MSMHKMTPSSNKVPVDLPGTSVPSFHVAFCVDKHYFRSMGTTITSLIENNRGVSFFFHVFTFSISDNDRRRLVELETRFNVVTQVHIIDPAILQRFSRFIQSSYYSPSIFSRLLVPSLLQGTTASVLYLDADVLCVGSIDELVRIDIGDQIAIVAPDAAATAARRHAKLRLKQPGYFNSGVMYINIDRWISNQITEKTINVLLTEGKRLRFPDQDALNVVLDGRAHFIDAKWNYLYGLVGDLENDRRKMQIEGNPVFIHFAGAVKPWSDWTLHESRDLFLKYHAISPWSDIPLDEVPQNFKEMRMYSRFLSRRGHRIDSLRWYVKYMKAKFCV